MSDNIYKTKEEVLKRGLEIKGIPLKEIDKTNRLNTGKGAVGSIIEEGWFGYKINNESEPDFSEAGVELKATPYVKKTIGIRAKERLVCNIINYMEEYNKTFKTSSFWKKCQTVLLMSYEHKKDTLKGDFTIDEVILFSFPQKDLIIIEQDWSKIMKKIRGGKAHEISESDTLYLGACTKGASSKSVRQQPFSDIPAKQRAYSLKQSYMSYILNTYIYGDSKDENIIKNVDELENVGFENIIINRIKPFIGRKQEDLKKEFNIEGNPKNINELILAKMLGVKGKIASTEEFQKANIIPKTIRINFDESITESMSFPTINFKKIVTETWDNSEFKNYLEQAKFLFIIFKYNEMDELIFTNVVFWNIPEKDLEEVKSVWEKTVWEKTVLTLNKGVVIKNINGRNYNNLPKMKDNFVCHVRPHARNSEDTQQLPDGQFLTKQCFWLNSNYIQEQIKLANLNS